MKFDFGSEPLLRFSSRKFKTILLLEWRVKHNAIVDQTRSSPLAIRNSSTLSSRSAIWSFDLKAFAKSSFSDSFQDPHSAASWSTEIDRPSAPNFDSYAKKFASTWYVRDHLVSYTNFFFSEG